MNPRWFASILFITFVVSLEATDPTITSVSDGTFCGLEFGISRPEAEQILERDGVTVRGSEADLITYDGASLLVRHQANTLLRPECGFECEAHFSPVDGSLSAISVDCQETRKGKKTQALFDSLLGTLSADLGCAS